MIRSAAARGSFVVMITLLLAWPVPALKADDIKKGNRDLRSRLNQTVEFSGFDDPKTTLEEALNSLASQYSLAFDVNDNAFKGAQVQDVLTTPIAEKAIPKMSQVSLEFVLRKILARVPADATYVIHRDVIEITTEQAKQTEWIDAKTPAPLPLISIEFDKKPLAEALQELTAYAHVSVVLDVRAEEQGQTAVTANLIDVPLDTAVQVLADMAGLRPVRLGNMLYVTTRENAKVLQLERHERALLRRGAKKANAEGGQ